MISSKCISVIGDVPGKLGHVLILTPLSVFDMVQFLTRTCSTASSFGYFPKLPTLIPWPGPQFTFWTVICLLPCPNEIQSSPVAMFVLRTFTSVDLPMCIPSVFMLVAGAVMVKPSNVKLVQPKTLTWKFLLSFEVMSWIIECFRKLNPKFCSHWNTFY